MEARELRIGNYVYLTKDNFKTIKEYQLDAFDIYKLDENECEDIKPIPLTEEWLLKFGFEEKIFRDNEDLSFDRFGKNGFKLERFNDEDFFISENIDQMIGRFDIQIKYVHQLQNLIFTLTGEELTLKQDEE